MSLSLSRLLEPDPNSASTEQRLVDLGLISESESLRKPRTTHTDRMTKKGHAPSSSRDHNQPARPSQNSGTGVTINFKQHSITTGTIPRRSNSTDERRAKSNAQIHKLIPHSRHSAKNYSVPGRQMGGMAATDRVRSRNARTFVGGECAACEELLEHTLSGERILQFSCGHVAHEACFYEYIRDSDTQFCPSCEAPLGLDPARGGSILDINKLSSMVRAVSTNDQDSYRASSATPMQWDRKTVGSDAMSRDQYSSNSVHHAHSGSNDSQQLRIEKLALAKGHTRNGSDDAPILDTAANEAFQSHARRHDYDLHAMESRVPDTQSPDFNDKAIPAPSITIRSEFPTLTRSRQQQSLACLVTIEVPEIKSQTRISEYHSPPIPNVASAIAGKQQPFKPGYQYYQDPPEVLERITLDLQQRVENWHGLQFERFGPLRLHATIRIGKDRQTWQDLECFLFAEMLICVKEKKINNASTSLNGRPATRGVLKGSILIRRHLQNVQASPEELILTLTLTVAELPTFHLQFRNQEQMDVWKQALLDLNPMEYGAPRQQEYEQGAARHEEEDWVTLGKRESSIASSYGPKTNTTGATDYSGHAAQNSHLSPSLHVALDIVLVIPVSSSMQGLKISLLRDTLRYLVHNLGDRDRMGLVTFGSGAGAVPIVGMTSKAWSGWSKVLNAIRPVGQKSLRADVVEGANVAMDLLMQRQGANPISSILLISDSSMSEIDSVDFVVQRAEAAKVGIYSFGLGLTHKPDGMIELSSRTKASYTYVKDWMMLRECIAGCLGSLQSVSHQGARIRIRLPEGSPAKFVRISGALHTTRRATGRDAEAVLGDLRFGDKRDILVQLVVDPDNGAQESFPQDHWESIVSGLEALGGSGDSDDPRTESIEEVPLLQADLIYGDLSKDGLSTQLSRPSLLTITMLPHTQRGKNNNRPVTPPIPPHPSIVQRRMELLTSDMLTRALTLVSRNQHDRAHHLLTETRTILKGLGKGSLPPLPPLPSQTGNSKRTSPASSKPASNSPQSGSPDRNSANNTKDKSPAIDSHTTPPRTPLPAHTQAPPPPPRATPIDQTTMVALDSELEGALEWINHPAVFSRDSRKAVLQAIGVISSQRAYTTRSASESLFAERINGVRNAIASSRTWRESEDQDALAEEQ